MMFNLPSRIILNILFQDIEGFLQGLFKTDSIAVSPIMEPAADVPETGHVLELRRSRGEIKIFIALQNYTVEEHESFSGFASGNAEKTKKIIQILLKKEVLSRYRGLGAINITGTGYKEIDIIINLEQRECRCSFLIPRDFFRLISPWLEPEAENAVLEQEILSFFKNPKYIMPEIESIIKSLDRAELGNLFNQLQRMNLLSIYQIYILITAYPDHSLTIKNALSHNTVDDVIDLAKKNESITITKQDIQGGIYSINEALFTMLKSDADLSYSRFLRKAGAMITSVLNMELLLSRDFVSWLHEIGESGLMHQTVSIMPETSVAQCLARDIDRVRPYFVRRISEKKLAAIESLVRRDTPYSEVIQARVSLILAYRKLRSARQNAGHESLDYMLNRFTEGRDYTRLLFAVGWFTLSTALKGVKPRNIKKVLQNVPRAAGYLMTDILKGILNPNIIQDEMQINKAKEVCVREIISLYDQGIINLED